MSDNDPTVTESQFCTCTKTTVFGGMRIHERGCPAVTREPELATPEPGEPTAADVLAWRRGERQPKLADPDDPFSSLPDIDAADIDESRRHESQLRDQDWDASKGEVCPDCGVGLGHGDECVPRSRKPQLSYPTYKPPIDWESTGNLWKNAALRTEHELNYWKLRALTAERSESPLDTPEKRGASYWEGMTKAVRADRDLVEAERDRYRAALATMTDRFENALRKIGVHESLIPDQTKDARSLLDG